MSTRKRSRALEGVETRTTKSGTVRYRGTAYDKSSGRRIKGPWTSSRAEARAWRIDTLAALQAGTLAGNSGATIREASRRFLREIETGTARTRSGDRFKPSAYRSYERAFRLKLNPAVGSVRLGALRRGDVQRLVHRWQGDGESASTIRNSVTALRALFRYSVDRGEVAVNPTREIRLPAAHGARDRVVDPHAARALVAVLDQPERAIWGLAFFAGLRRGEIQALRWDDVDLDAGLVRVRRSWDPKAGVIAPKSKAGTRDVPVFRPLRVILAEHKLGSGGEGLVTGRTASTPFDPSTAFARARRAWSEAGLESVGLHEARHCAASFMIAAGLNVKAISQYMGHASITITLDRYGHLLPGAGAQATKLMDRFFDMAEMAV